MKKILLILIASAMVFASCDNMTPKPGETDNIKEELSIEDYYPISKNTKYSYEGKGNEFATYTVFVDYATDNRVQTRTNNGGTESVNVLELKDDQLTLLYSRGETYFRQNFINNEYDGGKILLKEPLEEGNSWNYDENTTAAITAGCLLGYGAAETAELACRVAGLTLQSDSAVSPALSAAVFE
mgnify:CR=1 FL=1